MYNNITDYNFLWLYSIKLLFGIVKLIKNVKITK